MLPLVSTYRMCINEIMVKNSILPTTYTRFEFATVLAKEFAERKQPVRTYRAEYTYAITTGKWYSYTILF